MVAHTTISYGAEGGTPATSRRRGGVGVSVTRAGGARRAGPRPATGPRSGRRARARPGPAGPQSKSSGGRRDGRSPPARCGAARSALVMVIWVLSCTLSTRTASRSAWAVKATVRLGCNARRICAWAMVTVAGVKVYLALQPPAGIVRRHAPRRSPPAATALVPRGECSAPAGRARHTRRGYTEQQHRQAQEAHGQFRTGSGRGQVAPEVRGR